MIFTCDKTRNFVTRENCWQITRDQRNHSWQLVHYSICILMVGLRAHFRALITRATMREHMNLDKMTYILDSQNQFLMHFLFYFELSFIEMCF